MILLLNIIYLRIILKILQVIWNQKKCDKPKKLHDYMII